MDPSTLLSQLKDVHAPDPITFWPLAPGWWLLAMLAVAAIASLCYLLLRKRLQGTWKRQTSQVFSELRSTYSQKPSTENLTQINRLLKQALSTAKHNRAYLHLCESEWAKALKDVQYKGESILHDQEITVLSKDIYARETGTLDSAALERISLWIKHLG